MATTSEKTLAAIRAGRLTAKQRELLAALDARPDYWPTHAVDLAETLGWTSAAAQRVLYHLYDGGVLDLDESGFRREQT